MHGSIPYLIATLSSAQMSIANVYFFMTSLYDVIDVQLLSAVSGLLLAKSRPGFSDSARTESRLRLQCNMPSIFEAAS